MFIVNYDMSIHIYFISFQYTQDQIKEFKKDITTFSTKFFESGPGAVGTDLDKGKYR